MLLSAPLWAVLAWLLLPVAYLLGTSVSCDGDSGRTAVASLVLFGVAGFCALVAAVRSIVSLQGKRRVDVFAFVVVGLTATIFATMIHLVLGLAVLIGAVALGRRHVGWSPSSAVTLTGTLLWVPAAFVTFASAVSHCGLF